MAAPTITFAIPFYTGITYLARLLQSLVAQEDPSWEAVVCDDGPEQGVESVVRAFGNGRVRYTRNPQNLGIAGNFNRCLDVGETELVTVLHADDELAPTYCGTMRAAAERHPQAAAIFCQATIIGPESQPWFSLADTVKRYIDPSARREIVLEGEPGVRALLRANFIMAPTLCFRTSVLGTRRFPSGYKFVMDWMLTTSLLLEGETLVGIPDVCYRYRRHDSNATEKLTRTQLRFREESEFYDRMQAIARERGWSQCVALAKEKRIIKLNVAYRALKSIALFELGDAQRGFRLLREL